jgi:hypothetical protein
MVKVLALAMVRTGTELPEPIMCTLGTELSSFGFFQRPVRWLFASSFVAFVRRPTTSYCMHGRESINSGTVGNRGSWVEALPSLDSFRPFLLHSSALPMQLVLFIIAVEVS